MSFIKKEYISRRGCVEVVFQHKTQIFQISLFVSEPSPFRDPYGREEFFQDVNCNYR